MSGAELIALSKVITDLIIIYSAVKPAANLTDEEKEALKVQQKELTTKLVNEFFAI